MALFLFLILTIQFILTLFYKIVNSKNNFSNHFITLIYFAFILQYMAGLAYSGLFVSYPGFFLSLPLSMIILYNNFFSEPIHFRFFKIFIQKIAVLFLISTTFLAILIHQNFVYRDYPREFLTFPFSNEKMRGIFSNENNVKKIDTLVNYIQKTQMKMIIFLFFRISQ
jgi:hypothetical protein